MKKSGFTLIELSIVLIVIGLVAGLAVAGVSLLSNSETRRVLTDIENYKKAVSDFNTMYYSLPGDFPTASNVWAGETNGNGDGYIAWQDENYAAWRHLMLARLITGEYTGTGAATNEATIGVNVPQGAMRAGGYSFFYLTIASAAADYALNANNSQLVGNYIAYGAWEDDSYTSGGLLKPTEALLIDKKMDDGNPASGNLLATSVTVGRCTEDDSGVAVYDVDPDDAGVCNIYFRMD